MLAEFPVCDLGRGAARVARSLVAAGLGFSLALGLAGCASARMSDRESSYAFREGRYEEAAERLKKGLESHGEEGRDGLLYLLDLGLSLHAAGKYEESNQYLLRADRLAEIKDYTSLSAEGATLLTSENLKSYKGEDFEKVLINTYLAMNFALLGNVEDALVEARRVNHKLHLMVTEGERHYKQNAFARYLSAILYESERNFNDAYIDYQETWRLEPAFPGLGRDLWRMAYVLRMRDEMERWDQEFGLKHEDHQAARALLAKGGRAEIIVLYENGISPEKRPNPQFRTLPRFFPRPNPVSYAEVVVDDVPQGVTSVLHDIESTAIANLEEKYSGLIAKKLGGVVAKEVVADQIERRTGSPVLGALSRIVMYASDQADVRSWNLLPRDLQLARITVDPGVHRVRLRTLGGPELSEKTVKVEAGRKVFVNFRYAP